MKFKPIILACAVGCSFAFVLFSKIEECSLKEPDGNVVAIQIGVFTENCLDEKGVSYYLKKLNFEEESLEKSNALEELMMSTENRIKVNEEILKMYEDVL